MPSQIDIIKISNKITIYHRGPPLSCGPLPTAFYFSLSGEESLNLDPYNQPAIALSENGIRVISLTLPGHDGDFPHKLAIKEWATALQSNKQIFEEFIEDCKKVLDYLIEKKHSDPTQIMAMGLSRGAYIATLLGAKEHRIRTILGFAPLTRLDTMKEFENFENHLQLHSFALKNFIPQLINKTIRYYIGNHDTLVNTAQCFSFIHSLSETIYQQTHHFAPVELIIYPSIGKKGHGTPPKIFKAGALWLSKTIYIS